MVKKSLNFVNILVLKIVRASDLILIRKKKYIESNEKYNIIKKNVLFRKCYSYEKMISKYKENIYKNYDKLDPIYLTMVKKEKYTLPSLSARGGYYGTHTTKKFLSLSLPRVHDQGKELKKILKRHTNKLLKLSFNLLSKKVKEDEESKKVNGRKYKSKFMKKIANKWKNNVSVSKNRKNFNFNFQYQNTQQDIREVIKIKEELRSPTKRLNTQKYVSNYKIGVIRTEDTRFMKYDNKKKANLSDSNSKILSEKDNLSELSEFKSIQEKNTSKFVTSKTSLSPGQRKFNNLVNLMKHSNFLNSYQGSSKRTLDIPNKVEENKPINTINKLFKKENTKRLTHFRKTPENRLTPKNSQNNKRRSLLPRVNQYNSEINISKNSRIDEIEANINENSFCDNEDDRNVGFFKKISHQRGNNRRLDMPPYYLPEIKPSKKTKKNQERIKKKKRARRNNNIDLNIANNPVYLYNYSSISLYVDPRYKPVMQKGNSRLIKSFDKR